MTPVSRFEANLLRILAALLGRAPIDGVLPLVVSRRERPRCLSRAAVAHVQDALAKGCVWRLARAGGWRPERYLRGDRAASGRLWDRTTPEDLGLHFSRHALDFLIWLTARYPGDAAEKWSPDRGELTVGDGVLLFFAYEALRTTGVARELAALPAISRHPLCRLAFPEDFAGPLSDRPPGPGLWVGGLGACILEALQPMFAARWITVERQKGRLTEPEAMRALGRSQEVVLDALLGALDTAGRWDLARFLLVAAEAILRGAEPNAWVGSLALGDLRLADRAEVHRAALAMLRSLERLRGWERQARSIGYLDEGYALSQLWKADWEAYAGESLCARAGEVIRALDPLGAAS